jgi:predicted transcriptional regulator
MEQHYLENALYEYIKKHEQENIDSVDIVTYFKLRCDITLEALSNLEKKNKVKRELVFGFQYRYITVS